jgi:hypothetical protein
MARHISLTLAGERFVGELLDGIAPRTCEAVWNGLPIVRDDLRHPMYSGQAIYTMTDFRIDGVIENPYVMAGAAGDLLFHANPNDSVLFDQRPHANELYVAYGPLMVWDWAGPTGLNKFGRIVEGDVSRLAAIGRKVREEGFQPLTIERLEERA